MSEGPTAQEVFQSWTPAQQKLLRTILTGGAVAPLDADVYFLHLLSNAKLLGVDDPQGDLPNLGLASWYAPREFSTLPFWRFVFSVNPETPRYGQMYDLFVRCIKANDKATLVQCAKDENNRASWRFLAVVVPYYEYFSKGEGCPLVLQLVNKEWKAFLDFSASEMKVFQFLCTPPVVLSEETRKLDPLLHLFGNHERENGYGLGHILVNLLAVALATPQQTHMYEAIFNPAQLGKGLAPGSAYNRQYWDCGFTYLVIACVCLEE